MQKQTQQLAITHPNANHDESDEDDDFATHNKTQSVSNCSLSSNDHNITICESYACHYFLTLCFFFINNYKHAFHPQIMMQTNLYNIYILFHLIILTLLRISKMTMESFQSIPIIITLSFKPYTIYRNKTHQRLCHLTQFQLGQQPLTMTSFLESCTSWIQYQRD